MKETNNPQYLHDFAVRLNTALDAAGVSPKGQGRQLELARAMGISARGARRWLEGEAYPAIDKLPDLATRYGTTVDWLLAGHGDAPRGTTTAPSGPRRGHIPHMTWSAIRTWVETGVVDPEDVYSDLRTIDGMGPRGFAVSVPDDTMAPDFPEGGVLYMDPDLKPLSGDYVLALADTGGITFKRLICDAGRTFLRPLNPMYTVQQVADLKTYGVLRRLTVTRDFRR
jgi:SOS-response transcriptional repressor LexA